MSSCNCIATFFVHPWISIAPRGKFKFPSEFITNRPSSLGRIYCSQKNAPQQQLNLSVLRFTLGIPGLDESYLPRYLGYAFGALLVANHFLGSDFKSITASQLRTEALGLSLAVFSAVIPYLGIFLKGVTPTIQKSIPEGTEQIFVMSEGTPNDLKEDLAWGTYVLLRNTNAISVLVSVQDSLCVRGYWSTPKDLMKEELLNWFLGQIQRFGFSNVMDTMYFQQDAESELKEMFPEGTRSVLVKPILNASRSTEGEKSKGFVLLVSSIDYAYTNKDQAWIAAIANKFRG